uniref:Protein kinase domain-containing protein n=1 Tax=Globodera rostochiensis TaxID=31243 RepID=A0A914IFV9_GLORO
MSSVNLNLGINIAILQVVRCLDSGSYDDVYLCRNPDGDEFAVKIEEIGKTQLDVEISVYEKLAEVLLTNFCSFFSFGRTENICCGTLPNFLIAIANFLLDRDQCFNKLLDAIYALHDLGFVHCDIKMEN